MSNFYVGQNLVCVRAVPGPYQSLRVGNVYRIVNIHVCVHGEVIIDVGMRSLNPNWSGFTDACSHGCIVRGKYHAADRFRPLDNLEEQIERIEEEGAPVELEPELEYA